MPEYLFKPYLRIPLEPLIHPSGIAIRTGHRAQPFHRIYRVITPRNFCFIHLEDVLSGQAETDGHKQVCRAGPHT
jgi:hypothetical protein